MISPVTPWRLGWRIVRYGAMGIVLALAMQASGALAGWFVRDGYSPPVVWWVLTESPQTAWVMAATLMTLLVLDAELARRESPPRRWALWSSTLMLVSGSMAIVLHSLLWLDEGWMSAWHRWPLPVVMLAWAFPAALAAGIVLGFVNRFSRADLRWATLVPPATTVVVVVMIVEGALADDVELPSTWIARPTGLLLTGAIVAAAALAAIVGHFGRQRGQETEAVFLGLWMLAAIVYRTGVTALSQEAGRSAGVENYRIVGAVAMGVWVLAASIRIIEHVRSRRAAQR